ncbi:cytochrome P450 [Candidatus Poriferisocius sp.]|uniref:cytochrome P450 n=1 Tax=Candidatus Poriferisocius sp. TaxID=3101276 RepID=UPI003B590C4A
MSNPPTDDRPTAIPDDEVLSPERIADPHPYFAALRTHDPVHWNEQYRAWFIHRYDHVLDALRDDRFSSERIRPAYDRLTEEQRAQRQPTYDVLMDWLVFRDPPDHTRLRRLVSRAFTPRAVEAWRARVVEVVDELIDGLATRSGFDLIEDFAYPIPAVVIAEMMGVPADDRDRFKDWSDDVMILVFGARGVGDRRARAQQGLIELAAYLGELVDHYRRRPADNIISNLVEATEGDDALADPEIVANCVLFLFGGHETTTNLIGNGMRVLLGHPDQLARLRAEPGLIKPAVEEILRFDGPSKMEVRTLVDAVEMGDKTLPAGDMVYLVQHAANRDPEVFAEPDRFDITREPNHHIGFGFGLHFCLGASVARLEGTIALDALVRRLPNLELGPEPEVWVPTMLSRGLEHLPVSLT